MKYLLLFVLATFLAACDSQQTSNDMVTERPARTQPGTQLEFYTP